MEIVENQQRYISPLRYPGGKFKLAPMVESLIIKNGLEGCNYVEPYAGGAGLALSLLVRGIVSRLYLNDLNYPLFCFWHSALNEPEELLKKLRNAKITVNAWKAHRSRLCNPENHTMLDVGFSFLFLNRTNRSGIINGRMIGGYEQSGEWKIDARFYKNTIKERIKLIHNYKDKIKFFNQDAIRFTSKVASNLSPKKTLIYFDPPYYVKGQRLYDNHYADSDHIELAKRIYQLNHHWIVSYDNVSNIKKIYANYRKKKYSLNYSAARYVEGREVMFICDSLEFGKIK